MTPKTLSQFLLWLEDNFEVVHPDRSLDNEIVMVGLGAAQIDPPNINSEPIPEYFHYRRKIYSPECPQAEAFIAYQFSREIEELLTLYKPLGRKPKLYLRRTPHMASARDFAHDAPSMVAAGLRFASEPIPAQEPDD